MSKTGANLVNHQRAAQPVPVELILPRAIVVSEPRPSESSPMQVLQLPLPRSNHAIGVAHSNRSGALQPSAHFPEE